MTGKKPDYYAGPQAGDFLTVREPFGLFAAWLADATSHEPNDPNAMALASVDAGGLPNIRMVLLKTLDDAAHPGRGFVFYTNFDSAKGIEMLAIKKAALCFHWKSLRRQVRVRGVISVVSPEEADAYFASRTQGSQIGAWASRQSQTLEKREILETAVASYAAKYKDADVPRPPQWSGFRVTPLAIEFWHDRPYRLHDRVEFKRGDVGDDWERSLLYP